MSIALPFCQVVGWGNGLAPPLPVLASVRFEVKTYDDCNNVVDQNSWDSRYLSRDKFCAVNDRGSPCLFLPLYTT